MKRSLIFLFIAALVNLICRETLKSSGIDELAYGQYIHYKVSSTNGLTLGVLSESRYVNATNMADAPIRLSFSRYPALSAEIYIPIDEYVANFTLYDSSNHLVKATKLGNQFHLEDSLPWSVDSVRRKHGQVEPIPRWDGTIAVQSSDKHGNLVPSSYVSDGWTSPVQFPRISELFDASAPGRYKLFIQMQVFLKEGTNIELVRFPTFKVPVFVPGNVQSNNAVKTNAATATPRH